MKFFTLICALCLLNVVALAQNNPCPDVQSHAVVRVTNPPSCTFKVQVYATGDISSQKGLTIMVYHGRTATGPLLASVCHIVPKNSPSSLYETPIFATGCYDTITYVITRYTASNGLCGGGTCGTTITFTGDPGGPTPIELNSYFAQRKGNGVLLNWKTESEINAKEFVIERNSGSGFAKVDAVPAKNLATGASYAFTDNNPSATVTQYRLKLVDFDGSYKYSKILAVKGTASVSDFIIYPNPSVRGTTKVTVSDITEATSIQIIDFSGKVIKTIPANTNNIEINGLQTGTYMVRIYNAVTGEAITKRMTVIN